MRMSSRLSLLSVVSLMLFASAEAQNNLNNLGNVNGSNSIDGSSSSSGNSSNNVLDSDELNSNTGNSNVPSNSGGSEENGGLDNDFSNSGNSAANNSGNSGSLNNNGGGGLNNGGGGLNNGGGGLNNGGGGLNNGVQQGNSNKKANNNSTANGGSGNQSLNGGNTPPSNNLATQNGNPAQPPNAAPVPDAADAPPPPEETNVDPSATPPTNSAAAEAPDQAEKPRRLTRAERRQAQLELVKKMAESIPALRPGEAPLEYSVQPGDTLWDISDQLLDDAMWWPRLWVLNPEVTDPDKIEPGMRLLFYPSSAERAPELAVENYVDPFGPPKVELATLQTFNMDIKRWVGPNGEIIDASTLQGDQHLLSVGDAVFNATYLFRLPGFYGDSNLNQVGEVVSNPNVPMIAGQGQTLIGSFSRTPGPGERFMALRELPNISQLVPIQPSGNLFMHTGTVGVVRTSSSGYVTLVAEDNNSSIAPSDILVPANKNLYVPIDPNSAGRPNQAPGYVVATESGSFQSAGPGMAVFLQGQNGGNPFNVGDDVELFMPHGSTFGFDDEIVAREKVAVARIVDTTPDSAVGVILKASREVTAGASTIPEM
ncbi:MAG: LysM peptidoglycan-binding domain-containing protein [Silvanigrellaceae bacterium]